MPKCIINNDVSITNDLHAVLEPSFYTKELIDKMFKMRDKSNKAYKWKNSNKGRRR